MLTTTKRSAKARAQAAVVAASVLFTRSAMAIAAPAAGSSGAIQHGPVPNLMVRLMLNGSWR